MLFTWTFTKRRVGWVKILLYHSLPLTFPIQYRHYCKISGIFRLFQFFKFLLLQVRGLKTISSVLFHCIFIYHVVDQVLKAVLIKPWFFVFLPFRNHIFCCVSLSFRRMFWVFCLSWTYVNLKNNFIELLNKFFEIFIILSFMHLNNRCYTSGGGVCLIGGSPSSSSVCASSWSWSSSSCPTGTPATPGVLTFA